jgi:putative membrane protein
MILSESDRSRVSQAVAKAERATSGEIVPLIVQRSDDYIDFRWRASSGLALLAGVAAYELLPTAGVPTLLWAQVATLVAGHFFAALPFVLRALVPRESFREAVRRRAIRGFHEHGLSATRDCTGILILVSLLEHRVEILADEGIHTQVPLGTWDAIVTQLIADIRSGRLADGLESAVTACGEILKQRFPARPDDRNELPNQLLIE